jgi:hypothetical protein
MAGFLSLLQVTDGEFFYKFFVRSGDDRGSTAVIIANTT